MLYDDGKLLLEKMGKKNPGSWGIVHTDGDNFSTLYTFDKNGKVRSKVVLPKDEMARVGKILLEIVEEMDMVAESVDAE